MSDEIKKLVLSKLADEQITNSGFDIEQITQDYLSRITMDRQLDSLLRTETIEDPPNFDPGWVKWIYFQSVSSAS